MLAKDLIKDTIPPLKPSDSGRRAIRWMEEFRVRQLPVVNKQNFIGLITDVDVLGFTDPNLPLSHYTLSFIRPYINENQHMYDAVKFATNNKFSIIPVLNDAQQYVGVITMFDLVEAFAELKSVKTPGGIIILEFSSKDFSLAEVSQVVESNDARILSANVNVSDDQAKLELTLKINKLDLSRILAAFYRYNYSVKASFHHSEQQEDLQNRYDSFMNYLNI
jgi:acetoin utilization protein AcuB